jgi:hypothetical protein
MNSPDERRAAMLRTMLPWNDRPPALLLAALALCLAAGCGPSSNPSPDGRGGGPGWFEAATARVDLNFVHDAGVSGRYLVPEQMGSGGALIDFDNDGRLDLFLVQHGGPASASVNRLYRQKPDGRFEDVTAGSGLGLAGWGMGVAAGDVNNDGFTDLLVTEYGGVKLFLNLGRGAFTNVTAASGLDNPRWGTSAAWFDFDRDGWLDLAIANYLDYDPTQQCRGPDGAPDFCGPHGFGGLAARLFRNLGASGAARAPRFEDVTVRSGLARHAGPGLGVVCADFDGDRWPDIFFADDGKPNRLFLNRRDGTFVEEAAQRGVAFDAMGATGGNMGIALGDVDGNGLFDLFVTHLREEHHGLWTQGPRGFFQERAAVAGLNRQAWRGTGFGAVFADFDLDGALDLAFVNGLVKRGRDKAPVLGGVKEFWHPYAQRNQLFAGDGKGNFRDVSEDNPVFCGLAAVGRGLLAGDLDNDGALDLVYTGTGGPARVCRNVVARRGHWLLVRAIDPALGGRDALGAEITVRAGGRVWWRLAHPASSYLSSHDPRAHFGLGAVSTVDGIQVVWPDGSAEEFPGGAVDRLLVLRKSEGRKREE